MAQLYCGHNLLTQRKKPLQQKPSDFQSRLIRFAILAVKLISIITNFWQTLHEPQKTMEWGFVEVHENLTLGGK